MFFCIYFDIEPLPTSSDNICCYIQFLKRSFSSVDSIKNYINGVRTLHRFYGLSFPSESTLSISLTLRATAKALFREPKRAPPILPHHLLQLWRSVDFKCPIETSFYCSCLFAYYSLARKSSLLPPSASADFSKFPRRGDISPSSFGLVLHLKQEKCNQFGTRNRSVPLVAIDDNPLCPVLAFRIMISLVPAPEASPLFLAPKKGGPPRSMTTGDFDRLLPRMCKRAGLADLGFTGHSFRRGGATTALKAGLPGEVVQVLGGWASEAYKSYFEHDLEWKLQNARSFVAHIVERLQIR